jgi:hypothetical protein
VDVGLKFAAIGDAKDRTKQNSTERCSSRKVPLPASNGSERDIIYPIHPFFLQGPRVTTITDTIKRRIYTVIS